MASPPRLLPSALFSAAVAVAVLALLCSSRIASSRVLELRSDEAKQKPFLQANHSAPSGRIDPSKVLKLSRKPRIYLYEGFLSDEECDHLISLAYGKLEKSMVTDDGSGKSKVSTIHASSEMFFSRGQDDIIQRIEERISTWTFLPIENGEDMQIQLHRVNESYEPHYDNYYNQSNLAFGGHRMAAILMFLSNVTLGGETIFPMSEMKDGQVKDSTWSPCASTGYAVKPVKGNAILFFTLYPDATPDESSFHGGCMVLEGEKWSATKWIHVRGFTPAKSLSASDAECTDEDSSCSQWAANGECQRNPLFMLGTPDYYGSCRKSCGVC
uniref:procollagen-proline 4-dioxygenase n=1 Tax=Anthurium amnicola TaxID=1678845 RepID=A0A1D1YZN9_9ARAE